MPLARSLSGPRAPVAGLAPAQRGSEAVALTGYRVVAAVDGTPESANIARHACAMAQILGTGLAIVRVLEVDQQAGRPADPIAWSLRQRETQAELSTLCRDSVVPMRLGVLEGPVAEACCRHASAVDADLLVVGTRCPQQTGFGTLGSTARRLLERGDLNLLLVPPGAEPFGEPAPARILVPLDGSAWSETALPLAIRIARGASAELVLLHAVQPPELPTLLPPEPEDLRLIERLTARAVHRGELLLERKRQLLLDHGLAVRTHVAVVDDVRLAIADVARRERAGLVLLSARGAGHTRLAGLPFGHITGWISANCQQPVLVVGSVARRLPRRRNGSGLPRRQQGG